MANLKLLGKTTIIVAHRLETIKDCDTINIVEDGKIIAYGTNEELLKTSETYRKLYASDEN